MLGFGWAYTKREVCVKFGVGSQYTQRQVCVRFCEGWVCLHLCKYNRCQRVHCRIPEPAVVTYPKSKLVYDVPYLLGRAIICV